MFKNNSYPPSDEDIPPPERNFWQKIFPFLIKNKTTDLRSDLINALTNENKNAQTFSSEEEALLNNILHLNQARVDDTMIPRSEIEALPITATISEALEMFEDSGYSRLPIYNDNLDDPRGMLHIRDVVNYLTRHGLMHKNAQGLNLSTIDLTQNINSLNIIRNLLFVPHSMLAIKLLQRMQTTHIQMALVIDEHGGTDGLVSMEDLVELIIGDIEDEHDDEVDMIYKEGEHSWLIDGRALLEDVEEQVGASFSIDGSHEDIDTIGGLIVSMLDRIPARGETIDLGEAFRARILEADKRRIKKIRIRYIPSLIHKKRENEQ